MSILEEGNNTEVKSEAVTEEVSATNTTESLDTVANTPVTDSSFIESIHEDLRGDPSLKDIKDIDGLAKSYINAQKMVGGSLRIPSEEASKEQLEDFYSKIDKVPGLIKSPNLEDPKDVARMYDMMGRPKDSSKYKLDIEEKANELGISEQLSEFKQFAHDLGLNQGQANALAKTQLETQLDEIQRVAEYQKKTEIELKEVWGPDYNNRLEGAKLALQHVGEKHPDAIKDLMNSTAGNNPVFIKLLSEYGSMLKEDGALKNPSGISYGTSASDAKNQIQDIMSNTGHDYWNGTSPNHKAAVEKMRKLSQIAYSETGSS